MSAAGAYAGVSDRRPTAWWGMAIVIASEATLFAAMIGTYWYLRFDTRSWPPDGIAPPHATVPIVLTVALALTAVPMWFAARAAHRRELAAARIALVVALVVQAGYLAYQLHDFQDQLRKLPASRDAYTSIYYTMLGVDHAHVAVGILLVLWLLARLARGLTRYRVRAALAIAWYWYFVSIATLLVTATVLAPSA